MPARSVVIVVAPERFRDEELLGPKAALEAAGHTVRVASTRAGKASGMLGAGVKIDATLTQLDAASIDLLAIAGGSGSPAHLWDSETLKSLVVAMHSAGKPVGAICLSPPVLARAGILSGLRATTWPDARAILELKRGGATYVPEPMIREGSIVTADGPTAVPAFGAALVNLLGS
jgi:protease I